MNKNRIVAVLFMKQQDKKIDIDIPLDITANELIIGLTKAFDLNIDTSDLSSCCLKTENPIALLRGDKTLADYELRNGTIINYLL